MIYRSLIRTSGMVATAAFVSFILACNNGPGGVYQGYIEGDYLYVSSAVGGKVINVPTIRGSRVREGELLFELDPEPEASTHEEGLSQLRSARAVYEDMTKGVRSSEQAAIEASIEQAEASLDYTRKEYSRLKELFERSIVAEERVDAANAAFARDRALVAELKAKLETATMGARSDQIDAARNEMNRARALVGRTGWALKQKSVSAPADGLLVDVLFDVGELAPAGRPVAILLPPGTLKARFFIPEPIMSSFSTGRKVDVLVDGHDAPLAATITYISPEAEYTPPVIYSRDNSEKLVFMVEASFAPADARSLNPGQPVEIRLR